MENAKANKAVFDFKYWQMYRKVSLTGNYKHRDESVRIRKLVAFWKTIKQIREENRFNEFAEVLEDYAGYVVGDEISAAIAQMELLPTPVFRRMLWFYNIDFRSIESCIRRLTEKQIMAIAATYRECYILGKMPKCMKVGLWNRLRQLNPNQRISAHKLSFYKPQDKDLDTTNRDKTKGAIAYDFFDWGMGYNSYRKEDSDEKIPNSIEHQFLSPKNHENDFTVNQEEGGIYWFLYLHARANYLWGNKDEVQLKRSVCPGFYMTIIIWLCMILTSPLLLSLMAMKYVGQKTLSFINKFTEKEIKIDEDYWKDLWMITKFMTFGSLVLIGAIVIYLYNQNPWYTANLIIFIVLYLHYASFYKKFIWPHKLPWVGKPMLGYAIAQTLYDYHETIIEEVTNIVTYLVNLLAEHSTVILYSLIVLVIYVVVILMYFDYKDKILKYRETADNKWYKKLEKTYIPVLLMSVVMACMAPIIISIPSSLQPESLWGVMFSLGMVLGMIAFLLFDNLKPVEVKLELFASQLSMNTHIIGGIKRNKWLQRLVKADLSKTDLNGTLVIVQKIVNFARICTHSDIEVGFIVKSINEGNYKLLPQYEGYLSRNIKQLRYNEKIIILNYLLRGINLKKALRALKYERSKLVQEVRKNNTEYKYSFSDIFIRILVYIRKYFKDLSALKDAIDDRCPWVSTPKQID